MRIKALLQSAFDFCYPPLCAICEATLDEQRLLCDECEAKLHTLESAPACTLCAAPVGPGGACPHCNGKGLRPFSRIASLGVFDDPLRELIHHLKYHQRWPLAEMLGDRLLEHDAVNALLSETKRLDGALLPVPLNRWRRIARGFNQADLLATRLARSCKIARINPVVRWRWTETQTHLHSRAKRMKNLRDAFVLIDPAPIRGRHVVLIDDVMTTGATLRALARILLPARPASLSAIVLAVADPNHRRFQRA